MTRRLQEQIRLRHGFIHAAALGRHFLGMRRVGGAIDHALFDALNNAGQPEEIIGEIKDEFDDEESVNKKIDEYTFIFEGKTMINDVVKVMGLQNDVFETIRGDSDSLAGLVLEIAGEFPQVNEEVSSGDFIFVPLDINKNRINKVKVIVSKKNEVK